MNAAIEAAHAGTSGRGFSVVADEIGKLSENSKKQSKIISDELKKMIELIKDVVEASGKSQYAFSAVSEQINQTSEVVQQISASQKESTQISAALKNLNDTTVQVQTVSVEMSLGNKAILNEITRLNKTGGIIFLL